MYLLFPVWWIFTIPGRFQQWKDYNWPSSLTGTVASERQLHSPAVMLVYCFRFWLRWGLLALTVPGLCLLLALYLASPQGVLEPTVPIPIQNIEWYLSNSDYAIFSCNVDIHLFNWASGLVKSFFTWLVTPHT